MLNKHLVEAHFYWLFLIPHQRFNGAVDEFVVWNRSLNDSEVSNLYNISKYKRRGEYISGTQDLQKYGKPEKFYWDVENDTTANLTMQVRMSNDGIGWSDWSDPIFKSGDSISGLPSGRYYSFRATFENTDTAKTAFLKNTSMTFNLGTEIYGALHPHDEGIAYNFGDGGSADHGFGFDEYLVGRWDMPDNATTFLNNDYDGTNNGNVNYTRIDTNAPSGMYANFDGSGDFIHIGTADDFYITNKSTIMAWIKLNGNAPATQRILVKDQMYMIRVTGGNDIIFNIWDEQTTAWKSITHSNIALNVWIHLAQTYNGTHLVGYINGSQTGSPLKATYTPDSDQDELKIGGGTSSQDFNGSIDEVLVLNTSLDATEINIVWSIGRHNTSDYLTDTEQWGLPRTAQITELNGSGVLFSAENNSNWNINLTVRNFTNATIKVRVKAYSDAPCGVMFQGMQQTTSSRDWSVLTLNASNSTTSSMVKLQDNFCAYDWIIISEHLEQVGSINKTGRLRSNETLEFSHVANADIGLGDPRIVFNRITNTTNCSASEGHDYGGLTNYFMFEKGHLGEDYCGRNPATMINDVAVVSGQYGTSVELDGGNDYISIDGLITTLASRDQGTIAFWAKPTDDNNQNAVFSVSRDADATRSEILIVFDFVGGRKWIEILLVKDGIVQFDMRTDVDTLNAGQWFHFAVVQNGTEPAIYMNGTLASTTFTTSTDKTPWMRDIITDASSPADTANIGNLERNGADIILYNGVIDEFKILNRSLSSSEIFGLYAYGAQKHFPSKGQPDCSWNFNKGWVNSTTVRGSQYPYDSDCDGTLNGDANVTNSSISGNAIEFDGEGDYIEILDADVLEPTTWTLSTWIKNTGQVSDRGMIISKLKSDGTAGYALAVNQNTHTIRCWAGDSGANDVTTDSAIPLNTWIHIVCINDGTNLDIYINGTLRACLRSLLSSPKCSSSVPVLCR